MKLIYGGKYDRRKNRQPASAAENANTQRLDNTRKPKDSADYYDTKLAEYLARLDQIARGWNLL